MKNKIYDFCYEYGYETVWAFNEYGEYDFTDIMQLSTGSEEPDDFWDECGEDAKWDFDAYYAGMIAAFKEISGKTYKIYTDGYRAFAYTGTKKDVEAYNQKKWENVNWNSIDLFSKVLR